VSSKGRAQRKSDKSLLELVSALATAGGSPARRQTCCAGTHR